MSRFDTPRPNGDGWTDWVQPVPRGYKLCCCDCGLVHDMDFRIHDGAVQFRVHRNRRSTAQVRRWMTPPPAAGEG